MLLTELRCAAARSLGRRPQTGQAQTLPITALKVTDGGNLARGIGTDW
jgi:hypothetical protein